jgi:hypothetical protein
MLQLVDKCTAQTSNAKRHISQSEEANRQSQYKLKLSLHTYFAIQCIYFSYDTVLAAVPRSLSLIYSN